MLHFIKTKKPQKDKFGRKIFLRAPEITYKCASDLWQSKNNQIKKSLKKIRGQVVILTPHQNDVTYVLYKSLKKKPIGKLSITGVIEQEFPDGELKILIENEDCRANYIFIIASILNERDFSRVRKIADHYKNTLNAKYVTLICPYLGSTREDKNITSKGEYEPSVTSIRAEIGGLSPFIDKMIVIEPHSSATQACAAMFNIPLAPITPWKLMAEELQKKYKIDKENFVVVRPDKGRNSAAAKIGGFFDIPSVSFDKVRISGQAVTVFELSEEEKEIIKNKNCLIYDDEASTMGTVYAIAEALTGYQAKSLSVCLIHCKFTPGWETKMKHPLFSIILGTDSRQPIGNINIADNIQLVSLEPLIRELIEVDLKKVNFWQDKNFKQMVLQEE